MTRINTNSYQIETLSSSSTSSLQRMLRFLIWETNTDFVKYATMQNYE